MYGLHDVFGEDFWALGEVGDGSGDAEDLVVGAGGEAQFVDRLAQDGLAGVVETGVFPELFARHPGVGHGGLIDETAVLPGAGDEHLLSHHAGGSAIGVTPQGGEGDAGNLDVNVDAVEQWSADAREIALDLERGAFATLARVGRVSARTGPRCLFATSLCGPENLVSRRTRARSHR